MPDYVLENVKDDSNILYKSEKVEKKWEKGLESISEIKKKVNLKFCQG